MSVHIDTFENGLPWLMVGEVPIYRVWAWRGMSPLTFWRSLAPYADSDHAMRGDEFDLRKLPGWTASMTDEEEQRIIACALETGIQRHGREGCITRSPETLRRRRGRPHRFGSSAAAAADRQHRREAYVDLRKRLGMSALELADLLGQCVATVRAAPRWASPRAAPTDATLSKMRRELVRRTRQRVEEARLKREIEREILEAECREHMAVCGIFDPDDMEDAA